MEFIVEASVQCPWCGESFLMTIDTTQESFTTIEDCTVCCRPIEFVIECEPGEVISVQAGRG
jgi:Cysteine-rich CPXCG